MKCILCEQRKAKRRCPAKRGDICPLCCGEKRGIEIICPQDCEYFIEGQKNHQQKVTVKRLIREGSQTYIRRAELYSKNPELYAKMEIIFARAFRKDPKLTNNETARALELAIKTLGAEKKGLIYNYRDENRVVDELAGRALALVREYRDSPELRQKRITLDYARDVLADFFSEIKFYIETEANPRSYLIHVARYHPEAAQDTPKGGGPLIFTP
ncbi:MAG: hypothetical protein ACT4NX_01235 [Deltaproteobacteria bacterium]